MKIIKGNGKRIADPMYKMMSAWMRTGNKQNTCRSQLVVKGDTSSRSQLSVVRASYIEKKGIHLSAAKFFIYCANDHCCLEYKLIRRN